MVDLKQSQGERGERVTNGVDERSNTPLVPCNHEPPRTHFQRSAAQRRRSRSKRPCGFVPLQRFRKRCHRSWFTWQKVWIESIHSRFGDELLNAWRFKCVGGAGVNIKDW